MKVEVMNVFLVSYLESYTEVGEGDVSCLLSRFLVSNLPHFRGGMFLYERVSLFFFF